MSYPTTDEGHHNAAPEYLIARFRSHARRLFWSALVLVATAGAVGYFLGNLPEGFSDWMLLAAAAAVVLLLVLIPFIVWFSRSYIVTTQRVIVSHGVGARNRTELSHARGYAISVRRGLVQRLWGAGTITLDDGHGTAVQLRDVPSVSLVHETLADQLEIRQILAHRQQTAGTGIIR